MTERGVESILCCTSNAVVSEPRAPKLVAELSRRFPEARITFIDASPGPEPASPDCMCGDTGTVSRRTVTYPTRRHGMPRRVAAIARQGCFRLAGRLLGVFDVRAISSVAPRLRDLVGHGEWDLVVGHNVDTLPVVCEIGRSCGAAVVFDCMEYYSDMGEGQSGLTRRVIEALEVAHLPECDLVMASSPELADALERRYGLSRVVSLYNAAPVTRTLARRVDDGRFHLYWRNSTLGLGQRGLGDALEALTFLPEDVVLNVQGRPGSRASAIRERATALGVAGRVIFHPPYASGQAVLAASRFSVGLCPERDTCLNQRLTVSNKIFDYLMAGLAVIASELPGLARVVRESGGGLTHRPGDARELSACIRRLYDDRALLGDLQSRARAYAEARGNESTELDRVGEAIERLGARARPEAPGAAVAASGRRRLAV